MAHLSLRVLAAGILATLLSVSSAHAQAPAAAPAAPSKFDQATSGAKKVEGLWTIYYKDQQILVDLKAGQLNQDFIVLSSIAKGVSVEPVYGGMTWGDDVLWSFRKVGEKIHVLRRNVRFKARAGSPEANAVKMAYSDSVLYALPVVADSPGGSLVDMTRIFLSDDEQIGRMLGAAFVMDRSTVARVKSFPQNVEIDIAAVYSGNYQFDTVADPRGMQVGVHYSISALPSTGYKPRKADDRVGYFLAVTKDFTDTSDEEHFVRYITRWDLKKRDPSARISQPERPIKFYMEKTVPTNLRPIVRAGITEWNKAFEKLGFDNAIEVEQQQDSDDWDPEDIRYNTFRWITAEAGFAMGPSRVNPTTGQILDADIIFDASFLRSWRHEYENFTPSSTALIFGDTEEDAALPFGRSGHSHSCRYSRGMQQQMGFAAAAMMASGLTAKRGELPEEFLQQALKEVVMHEVGHTLGLRHNFKASTWKTLAEIEDANKAGEPTVASVMDYSPVNINPTGTKQSAYYTSTLGPYDHWAIEYGYKVVSGDENAELAKIASRSGEPGLDYSTDEDTRSFDPDPLSNRFDLGKDPVAYAERQMKSARELLPKILDRAVENGEGYQRARQAFMIVLAEGWRAAQFAARVPGGIEVRRDHKGDVNGRTPFAVAPAAQQRQAMKLLMEQTLGNVEFDPNTLNSLASTRWSHWGIREATRVDFPIHDVISRLQARVTAPVFSASTMQRIQDGELKVKADEDAYTLSEHLKTAVDGIFGEYISPPAAEFTARKPYISSFRRALQRNTLKQLTDMVNRETGHPEDARVLVRMHLNDLKSKLETTLAKGDLKLDDYSRAHVQDSLERVKQVLEGRVVMAPQSSGGLTIRLLREPGTPGPAETVQGVIVPDGAE